MKPIIECYSVTDGYEFHMSEGFPGVTLALHPQLIIRYGKKGCSAMYSSNKPV